MYPVFIAMLRKGLRQGFSFGNTFSTSSFFEILDHGTEKVHEDQLKDESQTLSYLLTYVFLSKRRKSKGKMKLRPVF